MEGGAAEDGAIAVGPWGGGGGTAWDDGAFHGVREITIVYARCIDSICVTYDKNGKPVAGAQHGGSGGTKTARIKLQFPEEVLISASGHYSPVTHGGGLVLRSLTLRSNRSVYGPFGVEEGTPFSFPMEGGQIVGFRGRSGWYVDAIGFHITRFKPQKPPVQKAQVQHRIRRIVSSLSLAPPKDGDQKGWGLQSSKLAPF